MVSDALLDTERTRWDLKNIPRALRTQSSDTLPSRMNYTLTQQVTNLADLLTVGEHPHILGETMDDLKNLCSGQFRLVLGESAQPLENRLDIFLSKQLLDKFLYVTLCQVIYNTTMNRLTRFSLPNLLGRQREHGEKLHQYLDKDFGHSDSGGDFRIDVEAI
jgi:hypothetical protein